MTLLTDQKVGGSSPSERAKQDRRASSTADRRLLALATTRGKAPRRGPYPEFLVSNLSAALTCPPEGFSVWSSRGTSTFWIYPE